MRLLILALLACVPPGELSALERAPPSARVQAVLHLIAGCDELPAPLRDAAAAAEGKDRRSRARILARAATEPGCRSRNPTASARGLARICTRERFRMEPALLEDLDEGTYAFAIALHDASPGEIGRRLISNLLLATALEKR